MINLSSKISDLSRVGKVGAKLLKKLGLENIQDLLFYLPFRYDDFSLISSIADLKIGQINNVRGEIQLIQNKRSFKRKINITEALVSDETDSIKIIWFNQPFLAKNLKPGDLVSLAGRISESQGQLTMVSPQYEKVYNADLVHTQGLIPNYHLTEGLTQKQLRYFIKQIITLADKVTEWLPSEIRKKLALIDLAAALQKIHFPKNKEEAEIARRRLAFSELFLRQLKSQMIKKEISERQAISIKFQEADTRDFVGSLPFQLTDDQKKAAWEIIKDLEKARPMSRLLEGDVGSGKTIVAAMAMLNVAKNHKKSALMAPTEILAEQHFNSLTNLFKDFDFKIGLLTGHKKVKDVNEFDIIVGTHAIIQKNVNLKNLALAIVDEQHRFGVKQRQQIIDFNKKDDSVPHFLSLTATPIPRSLALAIYGDLDLSIIKTLPQNRKPIITKLVKEAERKKAYNFMREQIKSGRQIFVICPLIDESDNLETKSVKAEYKNLAEDIFPEFKIGLLHGKMKTVDKDVAMKNFLNKETNILISTSVIEVGIDVPNASVILIEGAERFGLAQLHQFRGRVGRSEHQSYCLLFPSKEDGNSDKTIDKLGTLEKYNDGFMLAKIDLKMRGAGEIYGATQSGFPELQIASLFDYEIIKKSSEEAAEIIKIDADLKNYPLLREKLGEWEMKIHLE
ncbi:MAG TPA: ATP-dependent DNA helicase RecG [Candidatus Saccharimonadales bacterium]|nr:ATP-dependent DNA helicase RecG [Candidatus Saccharimonadales bacterium]